MKHKLKTWREYFNEILKGVKTFEVRKDDRGFMIGDILVLQEWNHIAQDYTGRCMDVRVIYILKGEEWGIKDGYVVMGIKRMNIFDRFFST